MSTPHLKQNLGLFAMMNGSQPSAYQTVYTFGKEFVSSPLSQEEHKIVSDIAHVTSEIFGEFEKKQCFANSQKFLYISQMQTEFQQVKDRFQYYEGYFGFAKVPIPILHGWIVINGKVVDLTLTQDEYDTQIENLNNRVIGVLPYSFEYIGIPIDTSDILHKISHEHETHTVLDDFRHQSRALRSKYIK